MTSKEIMNTMINITFMEHQDTKVLERFKEILEPLASPRYNVEEREAFLVLSIASGPHLLALSYSMEDYCWTAIHQIKPTPERWGFGTVERSAACQVAADEMDNPLKEKGMDHDMWLNDIYRIEDVETTIYPIIAGFLKAAAVLEYIDEK